MKKNIFPAVLAFIILLVTACSVTPQTVVEEELNPAVTYIPAPTINSVKAVNDETNPSITVTWNPVDKADFYVFEYESAVDYLSAEGEFKSYITSSNSFTIPSSAFTNSSDMRFIFKVKAAYKPSSSRSIIYSSDSEIREAVVLNTFSISPIIQENVLTLYSTFPKIKSVLTGGNIIQPVIKYYWVDETAETVTELESNTITLASAEKKKIRAELIIDEEIVATREVDITNAVDYYPSHLVSLETTKNEKESITLTWSANGVNAGLDDDYTATMRFYIERQETGNDRWLTLKNSDGETLYIDSPEDGGDFRYEDCDVEAGKDYIYRVITQYVLTSGENAISFDEKKDGALVSDISYIRDTEVKSFIITPGTGFSGEPATGDATYEVAMKWEVYHPLPEGMEYVVTRGDFDLINSNTTGDTGKYTEIYKGTDLGLSSTFVLSKEENKKAHNYTFYVQIREKDSPSSTNPMIQAGKLDENGNIIDGIIKTNPSIREVSFISSISATNTASALSDSVELSWEYNTSGIQDAGLNSSNVSVHILKKTSTDEKYTDITSTGVSDTSYRDEDVESGKTYYYILKPYYNDTGSTYNGEQPAETSKQATGTLLDTVEKVSATINTSNTSIDVSWSSVDNASGYVVFYREKDSPAWIKGATITESETTSYALSSNLKPGIRYEITVAALDSRGESKPSDKVIAEGEILGGVKNLKATGDSDIKSDSIVLTWDAVEKATSYNITIYDDNNNKIYSERISSKLGTSYTLSAASDIITKYSETHDYALSRKYYFTVTPIIGNVEPVESETKVAGYWVMPPKNITATKASYRDLIAISWDRVDSADKYVIYYREHGSSGNWTYLNNVSSSTTSINFLNNAGEYDFTVSTVIGSVEGMTQSYFKDDSNYGYPLIAPQMVTCTDNGNGLFKLSFKEVDGATSYQIIFEDSSWELNVSDICRTPLTTSAANKAEIDSNGLISYYFPRPTAAYKVSFNASVAATNKNAVISSKNTTSYISATVTYLELSDDELIKITFNNLHEIFLAANIKFENDWWRISQVTANISNGFTAATCGGETYNWNWEATYRINECGYMDLQNYSQHENIITTHITGSSDSKLFCYVKEVVGGYASTDNGLYKIRGTIEIQLPYTHGNVTIQFTDFDVHTNTGTAVINGTTYTDLSGYTKLL